VNKLIEETLETAAVSVDTGNQTKTLPHYMQKKKKTELKQDNAHCGA